MTTQATDSFENALLDHNFDVSPFTRTSVTVGLFTATPNDSGGGTEVSGNGYSRATITNSFGTASGRTVSNDTAIVFPTATGGNWTDMTHTAVFVNDTMFMYGALAETTTVSDGDAFRFDIGELDLSFAAGEMNDYTANATLNHFFEGTAYTPPTVYAALFSSATNNSGGGTELSGSGYARVDASGAFGTGASGGALSNDAEIVFPTATANWTEATHMAFFDAASGGNMLFHTALDAGVTVSSGDAARFTASSVTLTAT